MQFSQKFAALAATAATLASANSITFVNQDATQRTVVFTPNDGLPQIPSVVVPGLNEVKVEFPWQWGGNAYAVLPGAPIVPGMLAEYLFQGGAEHDLTFFDVSAIVKSTDTNNVKQLFPVSEKYAKEKVVFSGCTVFPCNKAYYHPDDVQTVATSQVDLICTLGTPPSYPVARNVDGESELVGRKFVLGEF
ncbi:hypothetical protein F4802DRAFT_317510 [Xylaria palmicola]|nr:hypothetical protein F4802DRAFT_317510 [Xylaria palmicola]